MPEQSLEKKKSINYAVKYLLNLKSEIQAKILPSIIPFWLTKHAPTWKNQYKY